MARPRTIERRRSEALPTLARAFSELGYRRATTAELARRCGVRENILYRLWADKKAMFLAAIEYVYDLTARTWLEVTEERGEAFSATDLLDYEAEHLGEFGHYRIIFAGLSETDDPEIRAAMACMYRRFHTFIRRRIAAHRAVGGRGAEPDPSLAAWALIGLGTVSTIGRELDMVNARSRKRLMREAGRLLVDGT